MLSKIEAGHGGPAQNKDWQGMFAERGFYADVF